MPELPDVETWRKRAESEAVGRKIQNVSVSEDQKVFDANATQTLRDKLRGRRVAGAERHGKNMWLTFDKPGHLYLHYGMSGSLRIFPKDEEDPPDHLKLRLGLDNGRVLAYRNVRRIGKVRWMEDARREPPVSEQGPDPFSDEFTAGWLRDRLKGKRGKIKSALLKQSICAGVGNWIADESLYQAGIDPRRECADLSKKDINTLHTKILYVLRKAVEAEADPAKFPRAWIFHKRGDRADSRTPRGESIRFDTVGGRTTVWSPDRQN